MTGRFGAFFCDCLSRPKGVPLRRSKAGCRSRVFDRQDPDSRQETSHRECSKQDDGRPSAQCWSGISGGIRTYEPAQAGCGSERNGAWSTAGTLAGTNRPAACLPHAGSLPGIFRSFFSFRRADRSPFKCDECRWIRQYFQAVFGKPAMFNAISSPSRVPPELIQNGYFNID